MKKIPTQRNYEIEESYDLVSNQKSQEETIAQLLECLGEESPVQDKPEQHEDHVYYNQKEMNETVGTKTKGQWPKITFSLRKRGDTTYFNILNFTQKGVRKEFETPRGTCGDLETITEYMIKQGASSNYCTIFTKLREKNNPQELLENDTFKTKLGFASMAIKQKQRQTIYTKDLIRGRLTISLDTFAKKGNKKQKLEIEVLTPDQEKVTEAQQVIRLFRQSFQGIIAG